MTAESPARATLDPTMSAITPPEGVTGTITVQLREIKLVTERLMMVLGVPPGAAAGAVRFVVAGCAHEPEHTLQALARLTLPEPRPGFRAPRFAGDRAELAVDCDGASLLLVGNLVVNVLAGSARETAPLHARILRSENERLLYTAVRVLREYGLDAEVLPGSRIRVPGPAGQPDVTGAWKRIETSLLDGIEVEARTWWQLYFSSNRALSVDTAISRYHTGDTLRRVTGSGEHFIRQNDPLGRNAGRREIFVDIS